MNKHNIIGLLVFVSLLGFWRTGFAQPEAKKSLRILCYNIHHGEGIDRKLDLERIAKIIRSVNPDLVALQEVDVKAKRSENVDQAKKLAELTKMNYVFGKNIDFQGGGYGNAILSRFPITKSENIKLPNHLDGEQRGVLIASVQPKFLNTPIVFWVTHFDHRREGTERLDSSRLCNKLLSEKGGKLTFLAGDFNDVVGSPPIETLDLQWKRSNTNPLATVPVKNPKRQIDFVWAAKKSKVTCIQTKVLPEAIASDHRAVLAVYELATAKAER